ncbi:DUF4190 domain-containing protein [Streptomyces subrutilus]|uniref:DUF4190 domain-containing protein n=1 Tax=Streptomyces subrutilus TaxID=36818 RepID=UPI003421A18F
MSTPPSPPPGPGRTWPPPPPPQAWGPPPGAAGPPPLNGFALASLLVGLLCFPPLGIVFGAVALVQIARGRQRGRPLALAGLAASVVMTVLLAVAAERVVTAVGDRLGAFHEIGGDVEGELTDPADLAPGDCFTTPSGELFGRPSMYRVDCAEAHLGEVTAAAPFAPAGGAGSDAADRQAEDECWRAQDAYAMDTWALPADAEMYYYAPTRASWAAGDRELLCVLGTVPEERRGSLRRDRSTLTAVQAEFLEAANARDAAIGRGPDAPVGRALAEYQEWAREVHGALGREAEVLARQGADPGRGPSAAAWVGELQRAREAWQRAARARTAAEFERQWDAALAALSREGERAVRGAYGLSTRVPQWLEAPGDGGGEDSDGSSGSGGSGPGRGPGRESA